MYCRSCGKEVNEKAVACLKCGVAPMAEKNYCYECGVETKNNQVICINCGVSLSTFNNSNASGLYRSSDDKIIIGLFGGLGHKFNINPWILRILALIIPGWPLYFVGLILPQKSTVK